MGWSQRQMVAVKVEVGPAIMLHSGAWFGKLDGHIWLVDAVRTKEQVDHFRRHFGGRTIHIHLTAPIGVLRERYLARDPELQEFSSYDDAKQHGTERNIGELGSIADRIFETHNSDPASLLARATAGLGLFPLGVERCVDVVVGAQYGSEGKGNICAHLASGYDVLMRVGGPNAGHKVAHPEYSYIQFPSGTQSNPKAKILIGAGATLSVAQVLKEIKDLGLTGDRMSIDPQAIIIEDTDRQQEEGTLEVIGSTKKGVGAATARKIMGRDGEAYWGSKVRLAKHIPEFKDFSRCTKAELDRAYAAGHRILLEGTQGTDLSIHHGSYPHVTSRETTASGCLADAGIAPTRVRRVIMVMRTYPIRVGGNSGPMMKEIKFETIAERSGIPVRRTQKDRDRHRLRKAATHRRVRLGASPTRRLSEWRDRRRPYVRGLHRHRQQKGAAIRGSHVRDPGVHRGGRARDQRHSLACR